MSPGTESVRARDYDHAKDERGVALICAEVYSGNDYVPSLLMRMQSDILCIPVVLECTRTESVLAFANLRALHTAPDAPLFLEAVRVAPDQRCRGLGGRVVQAAIQSAHMRRCQVRLQVLSVTIPANQAMLKIFDRLAFKPCGSGFLHNWPNYDTFREKVSHGVATKQSMLEALQISHLISDRAMKRLDEWKPVVDRVTFLNYFSSFLNAARVVDVEKTRSPCGMVPAYYGLITPEGAWEMIDRCEATAWCLSETSTLLVVHSDERMTDPTERVVVSVCASTADGVESAAVFADRRLHLHKFRLCIDCPETFQSSPLLAPVDATVFITRGLLVDSKT